MWDIFSSLVPIAQKNQWELGLTETLLTLLRVWGFFGFFCLDDSRVPFAAEPPQSCVNKDLCWNFSNPSSFTTTGAAPQPELCKAKVLWDQSPEIHILHLITDQNPSWESMWYWHQQSPSACCHPIKSWEVLLMVSEKQKLPSLRCICKYTSRHDQKIPFRNLKLGISLHKAAQMSLNPCYLQALWFTAAGSVSGTQHLQKTLWNKR